MKDWWIRTGCFLTGYKYLILQNCSEVAQRTVKRYTAALIIIGILWAFIGYSFVGEYLKGGLYMRILGGVLFLIIILQVERQIILSDGHGKAKYWIRGAIAVIMAVIGSIIVDQIIFQQDITQQATFAIDKQVDSLMRTKATIIRQQIAEADSSLATKEAERNALLADLSAHPTIPIVTRVSQPVQTSRSSTDTAGKTQTNTGIKIVLITKIENITNPKGARVMPLESQIKELQSLKTAQENRLIKLRDEVEDEARANKGFLFELQLMYNILHDSSPALIVWLLWFFLLFGIEIFIMVNKLSHQETDYDVSLQHHMDLRKRKLKLMSMQFHEV